MIVWYDETGEYRTSKDFARVSLLELRDTSEAAIFLRGNH